MAGGAPTLGAYPSRPAGISVGPTPAFTLPRRAWRLSLEGLAAAVRARAGEEIRAVDLAARLRARDVGRDDLLVAFARLRYLGEERLGLCAHDVQLFAAWSMLQGGAVEMETGEGKTLVAAFVAAIHALAGRAVHVVTANDYLAARDAATMRPLFDALGLSSTAVVGGLDEDVRRAAYGRSIVYVTPRQVMYDHLTDRLRLGRRADSALLTELAARRAEGPGRGLILRGLQVAVVDEADSVLVDQAATPLIISEPEPASELAAAAVTAVRLAQRLVAGVDFVVAADARATRLTPTGRTRLRDLGLAVGGVFANAPWREQLAQQALMALHLLHRDRDYVLNDGAVAIVDLGTGRAASDRTWERGLHQMVQAKEGLSVTAPSRVAARLTHEAFFRRYLHLSGMSGTLAEARDELARGYGLRFARVPTHRPIDRRSVGRRVCDTRAEKLALAARHAALIRATGRPVLVGVRSVLDSREVSRLLDAAGEPHRLLNALSEADEAAIIAEAGIAGSISVATNMAGRGTDIRLGPGVADRGGLHVVSTERYESRRIDRQLFGRCGRQGDPGSWEEILSLEDDVLRSLPAWTITLARPFGDPLRSLLLRFAQFRARRRGEWLRRELQRAEGAARRMLAFAGAESREEA
ncbi:MAG: prepilin peptidase [Siculibacillus sp.]|nr:prepilin peptidase [Siculibacillus sp.]